MSQTTDRAAPVHGQLLFNSKLICTFADVEVPPKANPLTNINFDTTAMAKINVKSLIYEIIRVIIAALAGAGGSQVLM